MSARIIFLNLCLAILFASQAKAQIIVSDGTKIQNDTIGEAQILVQYETRCISNTEKPENVTEETMMLEVGKNLSKFYSYTKYVCDSVLAVDFANKASQETINEHLKQYGTSKLSERTFRGYPAGKVTTLDEVAGMTRLCALLLLALAILPLSTAALADSLPAPTGDIVLEVTGKIDYFYEVVDFLAENEQAIREAQDQESEGETGRLF